MPPNEVLGRRDQNVVLACGNLLVNLWQCAVTASDIRMAFEAARVLSERYPNGICSLNVVKEGIRLPDAEARSESSRTMTESQKWLLANAIVLGGTGFIASAARATYAALQLAARSQFPQKVFGEIVPACQWLATTFPLDRTSADIIATIEQVLRESEISEPIASVSSRRSAR